MALAAGTPVFVRFVGHIRIVIEQVRLLVLLPFLLQLLLGLLLVLGDGGRVGVLAARIVFVHAALGVVFVFSCYHKRLSVSATVLT